ncbi:MAG: YdeI/OmpD-associated family protein [Pseudomonadales bacterium]|nr:YdeI/OmpD-associated family protein [Pseudomonadales bacterium]
MTTQSDKKKVDAYIKKHEQWQQVMTAARKVLLESGLEETVKWGAPAYTLEGKNLVGMVGFKNHCALWFHNGVYLNDPDKRLINAQEGRTRGLRQWRFETGDKLLVRPLKTFVKETIANQKAGKEVKPKKQRLNVPTELAAAMKKSKKLQNAFAGLTPGRQREYADHIGSAKQEATRLKRLEKARPLIEAGVGLNDKYKNC